MKVERVSYEIMTPAAARGILEAILWKPQMRWVVERIDRLKPVKFASVRRNEVGLKASPDRPFLEIEQDRQQRQAFVLVDVAYLVHARIGLSQKAGPEDNLTKYIVMFRRRAEGGQVYQQPCLGCREFPAFFRLLGDDEPDPEPDKSGNPRPGTIFYDYDWSRKPPVPRFFDAIVERGRMTIPPFEETRP
jgi:CRISPR-associated protein Cas5d